MSAVSETQPLLAPTNANARTRSPRGSQLEDVQETEFASSAARRNPQHVSTAMETHVHGDGGFSDCDSASRRRSPGSVQLDSPFPTADGANQTDAAANDYVQFPAVAALEMDARHELSLAGKELTRHAGFKMVGIRVEVFRIYDIDVAKSQFHCDFEIFLMWDDPTLAGVAGDDAACFDIHGGWVPAWVPQLRFHNEYAQLHQWARKFRITDPEKGRVEAKLGFRGPFYDACELHAFPFDRQVMNIVISSDEPYSKMAFCQHPSKKTTSVLKEHLQEWTLGANVEKEEGPTIHPPVYHDVLGNIGTFALQRFIVQIPLQRRSMFYVWNVGMYYSLITALAMSLWSIPAWSHTHDRVAIGVTLMLTTIALKFSVSDSLPRIPNLTYLDYYINFCFMMLVFAVIQSAISGGMVALTFDYDPDRAHTILGVEAIELQQAFDMVFFGVFGFIILVGHSWLVYAMHYGKLIPEWPETCLADEDIAKMTIEQFKEGNEAQKKRRSTSVGVRASMRRLSSQPPAHPVPTKL